MRGCVISRDFERRGTCPHCECRVRLLAVRDPAGGRRVAAHRLPARDALFEKDKRCPGARMVCLEDRAAVAAPP